MGANSKSGRSSAFDSCGRDGRTCRHVGRALPHSSSGHAGARCSLLSSRRELDKVYADLGRSSPLHGRLQLEWVGELEPEAAERLIALGDGLLGSGDADRMRLWCGRHPFYLQLLGRHLVDARLAGEGVAAAMDRFRTEAAARLRELWRALDDREREDLRDALRGVPVERRSLRMRGLISREGGLFGEVLAAWLREEM